MRSWRLEFHDEIRRARKVALRLGVLADRKDWWLKPEYLKKLAAKKTAWEQLPDDAFQYDVEQKGVDMRIGLNIASLCYKKLAIQIVLVTGDSDFVPAAKLARREGVDFVLDSFGAPIKPGHSEHVDALRNSLPFLLGKTANKF